MSRCIPPRPPKASPLLRPRARPNSLLEQVQRRVAGRSPFTGTRRLRFSAMPPAPPPRHHRFATRPGVKPPPIPRPSVIELADDDITEVGSPEAPAIELVPLHTNPGRRSGLVDGRDEVLERCQEGGMGHVYRVLDRKLSRIVALKTWAVVDRKAEYRLREEFRRAYPARHENLVRLFNLGRDPDRDLPYFTMEFIDGVDFVEHVVRVNAPRGSMRAELSRLRDATRQLTLGTSALHRNGLLHRDLKPSNVMVDRHGRVVVLDFGLADAFNRRTETLRTTARIEGTALYMAPEQAEGGALSPAVDCYAIGVMLFESVTGQLPFEGTWLEVLTRKREREAPRASEFVSDAPEELDELIAQLLRRDPRERATAAHLLAWCDGTRRHQLAASLAHAPTVQLPAMVLESRTLQLEALQIAAERVRRLRPTAVFVHGPSGTGKTAMIESVLQELARAPAPFVVLRGRCVEHETVPYRVFDAMINALARFLKGLPEDERAFLRELDVGHLLHVFPVLSRVPELARGGAESCQRERQQRDAARQLAALELRHLLYEIARHHLVAIHLDNLELADRDSVPLLDALLGGSDGPPLLLLGSFRDDRDVDNDMLALIRSRLAARDGERVYGIKLGALPRADSVRLARHFLEPSIFNAEEFAAALVDSCKGDAFLIEQLARLVHRFQTQLAPLVEARGPGRSRGRTRFDMSSRA